MTTREDRIMGVLAGQTAGDALGAPYEFRRPPKLGTATFGQATFGFEPGQATDDTEQALIVAKSRSDVAKVAAGLVAWYEGGPTDAGATTSMSLSGAQGDPERLAESARFAAMGRDPKAMSNGSIMRTGPVCLPFLGNRAKIAEVAREICYLTHASVYAGDACVIWSLLINDAICQGEDFSLGHSLAEAIAVLPIERHAFWWTQEEQAKVRDPREFVHNSPAVVAFTAALCAVYHAEGLEDGLQRAVAGGGDTDTVAAIAGALLGAMHGASAVPQDWRKALHGLFGSRMVSLDDIEALAVEAAGTPATRPWQVTS